MSRDRGRRKRQADPEPSSYENEEDSCPICMGEFDLTDQSFFPCPCSFQMCRFCFHKIENKNNRCPACRQLYNSDNFSFTPPTKEDIRRIKHEKKIKQRQKKFAESNARKKLANTRVIQRNLVYVTNLSLEISREEILRKPEYFGQFGRIKKIVVNNNKVYHGPNGSSVSAYITYYRNEDAANAIRSIDGTQKDGRILKASYGTTKYCSFFLRNIRCPNSECMYLHEMGSHVDSYTKEDITQGKHLPPSQKRRIPGSKNDYSRNNSYNRSQSDHLRSSGKSPQEWDNETYEDSRGDDNSYSDNNYTWNDQYTRNSEEYEELSHGMNKMNINSDEKSESSNTEEPKSNSYNYGSWFDMLFNNTPQPSQATENSMLWMNPFPVFGTPSPRSRFDFAREQQTPSNAEDTREALRKILPNVNIKFVPSTQNHMKPPAAFGDQPYNGWDNQENVNRYPTRDTPSYYHPESYTTPPGL
eukprot:TRINITY_DN1066_c0_g1_i1.p1 TRINITY_DN1066_c0_g1~~TRINITY_DN1066_c0_g1_i1.p1  ORF type:complete len:472 (-),score=97.12 TRINITY_DN1066_c0_g1_i1:35-1450(-)